MTTMKTRLPSKAATVEKALRMSVQGVGKVSKPPKYRNVRTIVYGIPFASKAEAARYQELRLWEKSGEIRDLELQKRFILLGHNGKKVAVYAADFHYFNVMTNEVCTEDVKGFETPVFKLKAKLFEAQYGYPIAVLKK